MNNPHMNDVSRRSNY